MRTLSAPSDCSSAGFSIWDNLWYSGHNLLSYSVLFGAASAELTPVAALSLAFPEGGSEPFDLTALIPVLVIVIVGWACTPRAMTTLRWCEGAGLKARTGRQA